MSILFSDTGTTFSGETLMGFLLALVVLCLAFIIVLTVIVVRQRRQIARKNECIVRNASLYLGLIHKKDVPELSRRRPESELSQVELVSLMQLIRKMLYGFALILPAAPVMAQDNTNTTYVFRFVPTDDMFYEALGDNRTELERLEDAVEKYYDDILEGNIPIRVDGYCNSGGNRKTNLKLAKDRSNRVKSELITFSRIVEGNFIMKNHSGEGDYVLVRLVVPKRLSSPSSSENDDKSISDNNMIVTDNAPNNQEKEKPAEEPQAQPVQAEQPQADETAQVTPVEKEGKADAYRFSLRANLLRWATLTPDIGIEWRINRLWSILVHGSWTSWSWNDKDRRYALWEVSPEVRCYLGKERRGYLGAMYKAGAINYKRSATGRQGDLMGGGITGGYQLRLNNALSLDFNLAVGCLHADYEKYGVTDGVRVRQEKENKNWWGPINAGVTLVWKMKN